MVPEAGGLPPARRSGGQGHPVDRDGGLRDLRRQAVRDDRIPAGRELQARARGRADQDDRVDSRASAPARVHLVMPKPSIFKKMQAPSDGLGVLSLARNAALSPSADHGASRAWWPAAWRASNAARHGPRPVRAWSSRTTTPTTGVGQSERQLAMKKEVDAYLSDKARDHAGQRARRRTRHGAGGRDAELREDRIRSARASIPTSPVVRTEERNETTDPRPAATTSQSRPTTRSTRPSSTSSARPAGIKSLSVAVFVDGQSATATQPAADDPPAEAARNGSGPITLPTNSSSRSSAWCTTAVGLDAARGDQHRGRQHAVPGGRPEADDGRQGAVVVRLSSLPQLVGRVLLRSCSCSWPSG